MRKFFTTILILMMLSTGAYALLESTHGIWVGAYKINNEWKFIKAYFKNKTDFLETELCSVDHEVSFQDGIRATSSEDKIHFRFFQDKDAIDLNGKINDEVIQGTVSNIDGEGTFFLRKLGAINIDTYKKYIGNYRFSDGRTILVATSWGKFKYFDGEKYVLMYPLSDTDFMTERAEFLKFSLDSRGNATSLTLQHVGEKADLAKKTKYYTEKELRIDCGTYKIAGSLLKPKSSEPVPAVVMVHGSGPQDREPFRELADYFARSGIAAFIYDKRGVGQSSGCWRDAGIAELSSDVTKIVQHLRALPEIDADHVGLYGASQGGWVLPYTAARNEDIAFLIIVSGPAMTPVEQDVYRIKTYLQMNRYPEEKIKKVTATLNTLYDHIENGKSIEKLELQLSRLEENKEYDFLVAKVRRSLKSEFLKNFELDYDPIPDFKKIHIPVLAIWGEKDRIVAPRESYRKIRQALAGGANKDFSLYVFPQANHMIRITKNGGEQEWRFNRTYADGYLSLQVNWLKDKLRKNVIESH